eukprot:Opistho-2@51294
MARQPVRAILFDKDGTLIHFKASWFPILRRAASTVSHGDDAIAAELLAAGGYDAATDGFVSGSVLVSGSSDDIARVWFERLVVLGAGERCGPLDVITRELDDIFNEMGPSAAVPVVELGAYFSHLKSLGLKVGIATMDTEESVRLLMHRFNIDPSSIDFFCGYDSGHGSKPGKGMLCAFSKHIGVEPSSIAMVGDSTHDMLMGRNAAAGLNIAVLTGTASSDDLSPYADCVLNSIADIEDYLVSKGLFVVPETPSTSSSSAAAMASLLSCGVTSSTGSRTVDALRKVSIATSSSLPVIEKASLLCDDGNIARGTVALERSASMSSPYFPASRRSSNSVGVKAAA